MLAELLAAHGYRAMHLGKWHLHGTLGDNGTADGGFHPETWYDHTNFLSEVGHSGVNRFGGWNRGLHDIEYCFAHRVADRAIDSLKAGKSDSEPLFLVVSFDEPHGPYICPPPFRGRSERTGHYVAPSFGAPMDNKPRLQREYSAWLAQRRTAPQRLPAYYNLYFDCNSFVDYEIGRVLDAVERYCDHNTVVIYTSDHGDHLGGFGLQPKGPTMYDRTIAVPLIIKAPSLARPGRREAGLVSSVDIWATILDLIGIESPVGRSSARLRYTGQSLLPILKGAAGTTRDAVFCEWNRFGVSHSEDDGFYPIRCIRTADWKLSINLLDTDELYDLKNDPEEMTNLIAEPSLQGTRLALHDRLLRYMEETGDVMRGPAWTRRSWRPDTTSFVGLVTTGWDENWEGVAFR
jgi:uncharacterized sulfatase